MTDEEKRAKEAADEAAKKAAEADDKTEKVELSQEKLQKIIDEAFARGASNGDTAKKLADAQKAATDAVAAREALEDEIVDLKKAGKKTKKTGEGTEDLDRQVALVEELQGRLETMTKDFEAKTDALTTRASEAEAAQNASSLKLNEETLKNEVIRAAGAGRAVSPDEVFTLMRAGGVFELNSDGQWQVMNPSTGQPRIDVSKEGAGNPLSVGAAVDEFLDQRKHMVQPSGRTGSGQGAGTGDAGDESNTEGLPKLPDGVDPQNVLPSQLNEHRAALQNYITAGGKLKFGGTHNQATG